MIKFLKSNTAGKNNKNESPIKTRNSNKQSKVINCENKFIECLQSISCLISKILLEIEKLQKNNEIVVMSLHTPLLLV